MTEHHRIHARKGLTTGLLAAVLLAVGGWRMVSVLTGPTVGGTAGAAILYATACLGTGFYKALAVYDRYRLYRRTRPE